MSRKSNPVAIGIFTLVGLVLAFGTVIFVGSAKIFSREEPILFYFDESVAGLSAGAPVKFRGVPIGTVSDVLIRLDQAPDSTAIPVIAKINAARLATCIGETLGPTEIRAFRERVAAIGLMAKLQIESLISGQLYIELDYYGSPEGMHFEQQSDTYKEIPTTPSVMAQFNTTSSDIITKLTAVDLEAINDQLLQLLRRLNERVEAFDAGAVATAVVSAAQSIEAAAGDGRVSDAIDEFRALVEEGRILIADLQGASGPAVESFAAALARLEGTLAQFERAGTGLSSMMAAGSDARTALNELMLDLAAAARAVQDLAAYLEQNPKSILSGRPRP